MSIDLRFGDCLDVMAEMDADSIDTIVTDPPYGLEFMGKDWDHGVPGIAFWKAALRVAKPGAIMLAFGGTRTHHRLMCAIEDAGWEIRDCLMWLYGSGMNHGTDISKAIDKAAGAVREIVGVNEDRARRQPKGLDTEGRTSYQLAETPYVGNHDLTVPATDAAATWEGWNTTLKPAWEPIVVAMKPKEGTFAQNAEKWGVSGFWIEGCRIPTDEYLGRPKGQEQTAYNRSEYSEKMLGQITAEPDGRYPANVFLDPTSAAMLDEQVGNAGGPSRFFYCAKASRAERWFYCMRCDDAFPFSERNQHQGHNEKRVHIISHPTQKPETLLRYLVRLTKTPAGGTVLDPFMGTGSTGVACIKEGRSFVGVDNDRPSYVIAYRKNERIEEKTSQEKQLELLTLEW